LRAKPLATIASVGLSKFGRRQGVYARELFAEAALEAFGRLKNFDSGKDIKASFIGQMSESYEHQSHVAPMSASWAGLLLHRRRVWKTPAHPQGLLSAVE